MILEKSIQKTREWLHEIQRLAGYGSELEALGFLRATLHELRDNLPLESLAQFSSQLPLVIRGLLFEEWNPSRPLLKERKREEFLDGVCLHVPDVYKEYDIEQGVVAVLATLANRIDINEMLKLQKILPKGIRELFRVAVENCYSD